MSFLNLDGLSRFKTKLETLFSNEIGKAKTHYGICSTTGSSPSKTVDATGFALQQGSKIIVKFTNTNTAQYPTLNVGNTGAAPIYYDGTSIPIGYIEAGKSYLFTYNGTQYDMVGDSSQIKVPSGVGAGKFLQTDEHEEPVWGEAASPAAVVSATEAWLDNNISGGETIAIDASLSVQGAGADSKAVGDAIEELTGMIENDLGCDVDFDTTTEILYLTNSEGQRIGLGTSITAGISGLDMDTEQDAETGVYYLVMSDDDGNEICRVELPATGGGGGSSYVARLINGMSSLSLSFPAGQTSEIDYSFYEYYGNDQTSVNAQAVYSMRTATTEYEQFKTETISQGSNTVDITDQLQDGTNYLRIQVTGGESGIVKTLNYTITVVDISLTSSFDDTQAYSGAISFMYRVKGRNISKTMKFYIDNNLYATENIGTSHNVQLTKTIDLSTYGHGHHMMRCYFETEEGATSPELVYDIIYDSGVSTPIISSTFNTTSVEYGTLIQVPYVVFTHGSDYTSSVSLDIYTMDGNTKVPYAHSALQNVVNQTTQYWNITEYPTSGTIYLEISSGLVVRTFEVEVEENTGDRDLSGVTTRLIASYSASGRSNSDANRSSMDASYTSLDNIDTTIRGSLSGFNWRSNGWVSDDNGYPVLRVSGGAEVDIDMPFFASSWEDENEHTIRLAGTPTGAGRTFEVAFKTSGVTDESAPVITVWDNTGNIGIKVFPSRAYILSSTMSVTTDADGNVLNKNAIPYAPFSSQSDKVRLTFVLEEVGHYVETEDGDTNKQLIRIYVNGQLARAVAYTNDDFTTSLAKPHFTAESCVLDIYSMRFYDYALSDADVLKNYIADLPSVAERIVVYDKNAIVDDNNDIDFALSALQYPCMVLTGTLSAYKGDKVKIGVRLYKPDGTVEDGYYIDWDFMDKDGSGKFGNVNNVQGTSSQYYLKKNYKITFYRWDVTQNKFVKVKISIFPDSIPVNTICIKADYMSPDSANTGNANFWQAIIPEKTPPQVDDDRVQTSVCGYPILLFQCEHEGDQPVFIGRYNLNNDKGTPEAYGLVNDGDDGNDTKCQKWEYKDNSEDICNFLTDRLHQIRTKKDGSTYEAWEDALESCYPDQGDLEDDGLLPDLSYMQIMYSWVCQRANFIDASTTSGTGGVYNGVGYDTEYDLKYAIFRNEFEDHFNLSHTLHYFIANEVALLVDNLAKNLFMTTYDTTAEDVVDTSGNTLDLDSIITNGVVDISTIDWANSSFAIWYPTLYDLDSCLGADNNGFDQFPYYKEMWDTYNNKYVVNGHASLFWRLVYAAYYNELKALYCNFRDTSKTLSPALYTKAMIDDLTDALPIVAVNKDEKFKYIDAYEGGYWDGSAADGEGAWVYTTSYLYLVKSTMESYHRDFINKRFAMLDSKYLSDAYTQDYFNVRINRAGRSTPAQLAFNVEPCQAMYCYTEWGNSGSYIGDKCLEGDTVEMKPASEGTWSDIVVNIFGASHLKSAGDLSVLYPSKLQGLSRCVNMTELILGSTAAGYENSSLDSIADVVYLKMLQKLNISNCTVLSGTVDLSNCDLIEEVYASGSGISAIVLPNGGYLTKLHLPSAITALNVLGHSNLTEFSMDSYSNLLRLHVENTPVIPTDVIVATRGTNLQRIRLVGVNWNLSSETALEAIADSSMSRKAIDANGNPVDSITTYPTITGTVTINRIRGSLLTRLNQLYPDLTINYTTKYHVVTFMNEGELHATQEVNDGANATNPTTPLKEATTQYLYSFNGWDGSLNNVQSDITRNAQYSSSLQQYTLKFYDSGDTSTRTLLETVSGVSYGQNYVYPSEPPTIAGNVFGGWQDADGHVYEYPTQMPTLSTSVDSLGHPNDVELFPYLYPIQMPTESKSFDALNPGEMMFCAIAIQNGSATGCTVTYYADSSRYVITQTATNITASIAIADTKQWTLYNNETITQQVVDFNHDFSDLNETHHLGITYGMENLLTDTHVMNPSYKHAFNYRFGNESAIVSDTNNHSSGTDAALTHEHNVTAAEVTAGKVDITVLGPTYLDKIVVRHIDNTTETWYFADEGFYGGTDAATFTQSGAGQAVSCPWYKSDLDVDANNVFHKIGKMMQVDGNVTPVNSSGASGSYGWASEQIQWGNIINRDVTFTNFGGIRINATGDDSLNTSAKNPFNGTGKSRITFCKDWTNDLNNFTEVSEGTVISIPVVSGDTVTVVCYGYSRNWGGWDNSDMNAFVNSTVIGRFPYGLYSIIVPTCKKSSVGNRSYAIQKGLYKVWLYSYGELTSVSSHPYMDEGTKYPVFTTNASRIKYRQDGAGAVGGWWERDPNINYSNSFMSVGTSGYPHGGNYAYYGYGVCLGFCSGELEA